MYYDARRDMMMYTFQERWDMLYKDGLSKGMTKAEAREWADTIMNLPVDRPYLIGNENSAY